MKIIGILIALILSSCVHFSEVREPHIIAADDVMSRFIRKGCQDYHLQVQGTGGRMMGQIENMWVGFIAYEEFNLDQARVHFLQISRAFIDEVEMSQKIKSYLKYSDNPVLAVSLSLTYRNSNHKQPLAPSIAHIYMLDGIIYYSIDQGEMRPYKPIFQETYQEALERANCTH